MSTRKYLGDVAVDPGQLLIVDPCYLEDWDDKQHYDRACDATSSGSNGGPCFKDLAVACSTIYGDGRYPVYLVSERGRNSIVIDLDGVEEEY